MGRTDSLHHARLHAPDPADRMHAGVLLAETMIPGKLDSALVFLEEASGLVNEKDGIRKANYFNTLGDYPDFDTGSPKTKHLS